MRTIKFISIIILLSGFTFALIHCTEESISLKGNLELELRTTSCLPDLGSVCTQFEVNAEQIQLPGYPGCDFWIKYTYQECYPQAGLVRFNIGDVMIIKHNCQQFWDDLETSIANGTVEQFWIGINKLLYKYVTDKLINTVNPSEVLTLAVNYHIASCQKMCIEERREDPQGPFKAYYIHCGDKCCALYTYYSVVNGNWVLLKKPSVTVDTDLC